MEHVGPEPKTELTVSMLAEGVREPCRKCLSARLLGGLIIEATDGKEHSPEDLAERFADFVNQCEGTPMVATVGACSEKSICSHHKMPEFEQTSMRQKATELVKLSAQL